MFRLPSFIARIPKARTAFALQAALLIATLYGFSLAMEAFGGFSAEHLEKQYLELALTLYLYGLSYSLLKPFALRGLLAAIPIILIYLIHDVFYLALGKVFRLINLVEIPELLQILPLDYAVLLVLAGAAPMVLFLMAIDRQNMRRAGLWLLPCLILVIGINAIPNAFAYSFERMASHIVKYSDAKSVENNGRIAMLLYREAQRHETLMQIEPYRDRPAFNQSAADLIETLRPHGNGRNVHLIVLESFLDPRLFRDLSFSRSPAHADFDKLFGDKLGLSIAPVFGGATAQAEFEVLCGVPAFERLSSVEFNVFTGAQAHCLPGLMNGLGYRSIATNTYKPNFFNALPGYSGMGFSEIYFPKEFSGARESYFSFGDPGFEEYLFDQTLFEQNLAFVKEHLSKPAKQPLFNYVLTIYGHTPHRLQPHTRPEVIQLDSHYPDDHLQRTVNQFYYRTEAIAAYVRQLQAVDKESLIILISDHVPPLRNGPNTYNALKYMGNKEGSYYHNRLAIIENGEFKVYPVMRHYDLPSLVLNSISNGDYCRNNDCVFMNAENKPARETYMENYMRLMAHAAE